MVPQGIISSTELLDMIKSEDPDYKEPIILPPDQINVIRLDDFLAMELPPRELIMSPWLPQQGIAMIHAKRGVGKTFFTLTVAYVCAIGGEFLNWFVMRPRRVLYIDGEMPAATLQMRLAMIAKMYGCKSPGDRFHLITPDLLGMRSLDLSSKDHQDRVSQIIIDKQIELVIIDNVSALMPGIIENQSDSWAPIQTWELYIRKLGCSIIRIMHTGKTGKVRATSKVEDIVDTTIYLQSVNADDQTGARFTVEFEKNREFYGEDAKSFEAYLKEDDQGVVRWNHQGADVSSYKKVIELANAGHRNYEIAEALNISKVRVSQLMDRGKASGLIVKPMSVKYKK